MTDKEKIRFIQRRNSDVAKRLIFLSKEITSDALMTEQSKPSDEDETILVDDGSVMGRTMKRSDYDAQFKKAQPSVSAEEIWEKWKFLDCSHRGREHERMDFRSFVFALSEYASKVQPSKLDDRSFDIPTQPVLPITWWCSICGEHITCNTTKEIDNHVVDYHTNLK
jgi:hypothetical protein